jgi:DNA-binding PadR family transcriptional regulator
MILFALLELDESEAYGVPIREAMEKRTGRSLSSGAVYTALDRLRARGLLESWVGEPTPERGGRRKRYYRLAPEGLAALDRAARLFEEMSKGLLPTLRDRLAHVNDGTGGGRE